MATLLTTRRMSPELAARVQASVNGRRAAPGARLRPRSVSALRVVAILVIGLALGTAFRFLLYRYWVFGHHRADGLSNLERVEEAQRTLFEEPGPQAEPAPPGEGGTAEPVAELQPADAPSDAVATPRASRPSAGTTEGTPPPGS